MVMTNLLLGVGIIAVAVVGGLLFIVHEARQERLYQEQVRREVEELREQYGKD